VTVYVLGDHFNLIRARTVAFDTFWLLLAPVAEMRGPEARNRKRESSRKSVMIHLPLLRGVRSHVISYRNCGCKPRHQQGCRGKKNSGQSFLQPVHIT